jgi:hypothetical protein
LCPIKKNKKLLVAFSTFGWIFCIFRCLDIRADVCHGETLVFFTGAGGTFPEVLLALVQRKFFSAIDTHIFSRADFLSRGVRLLFGQDNHQNSHARQRYIWVVFVPPVSSISSRKVTGAGTYAKLYCGFSHLLFYGKKGDRPARESPV